MVTGNEPRLHFVITHSLMPPVFVDVIRAEFCAAWLTDEAGLRFALPGHLTCRRGNILVDISCFQARHFNVLQRHHNINVI